MFDWGAKKRLNEAAGDSRRAVPASLELVRSALSSIGDTQLVNREAFRPRYLDQNAGAIERSSGNGIGGPEFRNNGHLRNIRPIAASLALVRRDMASASSPSFSCSCARCP